jgi:hypothetical protein
MNFFSVFRRIFALAVFLPPLYVAYRYFRWQLKQAQNDEEI